MKVILRENITNLGKIGEHVSVRRGYARNYLIPNNKVSIATEENIKIFKEKLEEIENQYKKKLSIAEDRAKKLQSKTFEIKANVSDMGRMFGSINRVKIAEVISNMGCAISKKEIHLKEGVIKSLGKHNIKVVLHEKVRFSLSIDVIS